MNELYTRSEICCCCKYALLNESLEEVENCSVDSYPNRMKGKCREYEGPTPEKKMK